MKPIATVLIGLILFSCNVVQKSESASMGTELTETTEKKQTADTTQTQNASQPVMLNGKELKAPATPPQSVNAEGWEPRKKVINKP